MAGRDGHRSQPLACDRSAQRCKEFSVASAFSYGRFYWQSRAGFEVRHVGGNDTDLLIKNRKLGRALADMFKSSAIVLMRGHGSTVVAETLQKAVYRAVYAEINARYQMEANKLGPITYLTEEEARSCVASVEGQIQRPWDLWTEEARMKAQFRGARDV
jgi:hypothetical protein